jgi:hypothetical protein
MTARRVDWRRDDGRVSLLVAVCVAALLFLIAVVVDGGGRIRAMQEADNIAAQAARTAGQAIDLPAAITGGTTQVDPDRAAQAAQSYLDSAGATGTVTISSDRRHIAVTATLTYTPIMLGAFGYHPVTVTGHATAELVDT